MRGGIEIDRYGAPVAYHIRKNHPGDYWIGGATDTWERIPAYTDFGRRRMLHVHDVERLHTPPSFLLDTFFPNVQTSEKFDCSFRAGQGYSQTDLEL